MAEADAGMTMGKKDLTLEEVGENLNASVNDSDSEEEDESENNKSIEKERMKTDKDSDKEEEDEGGRVKEKRKRKDDADGTLLPSTADRILEELQNANKEKSSMQEYVRSCVESIKEDVRRVEKKAEEIDTVRNELKDVRIDVRGIATRVDKLENGEGNVVEEVRKHLIAMEREESKDRDMINNILEEIADKEKCALVVGFLITSQRILSG